jgi:hypothetical protein
MYDDPAKLTLSEDSQFPDQLYTIDKLGPAKGLGNGLIASLLILLPIIALVIWL